MQEMHLKLNDLNNLSRAPKQMQIMMYSNI